MILKAKLNEMKAKNDLIQRKNDILKTKEQEWKTKEKELNSKLQGTLRENKKGITGKKSGQNIFQSMALDQSSKKLKFPNSSLSHLQLDTSPYYKTP
ncbi:hypothetical protein TNCV_4507021 [Trichonephila clavipes]|nr:hypothetical protein TNCV_4507021 [Trichonephila clavipes]